MTGIRAWISGTSSFAVVVITAKVRTHSSLPGLCQFSQMPASAKGLPDFMAMAKGCFACALDRLPIEEVIDRQQAAPLAIRVAERGERSDGLALRVDRSVPAAGVLAPALTLSVTEVFKLLGDRREHRGLESTAVCPRNHHYPTGVGRFCHQSREVASERS